MLKLVFAFYFLAWMSFHQFFMLRIEKSKKLSAWLLGAGFFLHTINVSTQLWQYWDLHQIGIGFSLNLLAYMTAVGLLIAEGNFKIKSLRLFTIPLTLLFLLYPSWWETTPPQLLESTQGSIFLLGHMMFSFLGYASMFIATELAIMYLLQERDLKRKKLGLFFRNFPTLDQLEKIHYRTLSIGFAFLTLGIISGLVYAKQTTGLYMLGNIKVICSILTWFFYAVILHSRLTYALRGKKVAILSIIAIVLILVTFGINYGSHAYL